ncbi:MAG: membrane protein insertion efficiency factor YidD [Acidobacteriota bacterium]
MADWQRPPEAQVSTATALRIIEGYQRLLSPRMDSLGVCCRFTPTCSHYGHAVIEEHGLPRGAALTARRIARCGPWTPMGTVDPP